MVEYKEIEFAFMKDGKVIEKGSKVEIYHTYFKKSELMKKYAEFAKIMGCELRIIDLSEKKRGKRR